MFVRGFFYKQHFYKQRHAEIGKKANAQQHSEAELLLFENYSHSSSTLFKNNRVVYTTPTFSKEEGRLNLQPNFQKRGGGLTGPQLLEGGCWERGGDFFHRGLQFSHKR